ncbi:12939_t:CDS:2 [Acaulospora morrowiae]|uniref:12939_t:CDS:1 n=1 Tax=Acaulospora morrowiae TaxID=94023 RepID=A0A9N8ZPV9_9GLOM|nr:12939_t:CDS:2 [Acaulospora morrowiae]
MESASGISTIQLEILRKFYQYCNQCITYVIGSAKPNNLFLEVPRRTYETKNIRLTNTNGCETFPAERQVTKLIFHEIPR